MKVQLTVELEVEPEKELDNKEMANATGMMVRQVRNRLNALVGCRLGGEKRAVGWEVHVKNVEVKAPSKVK